MEWKSARQLHTYTHIHINLPHTYTHIHINLPHTTKTSVNNCIQLLHMLATQCNTLTKVEVWKLPITQWTKSCKATRSKISKVRKTGVLMTLCTSATDGGFPSNHLCKNSPVSIVHPALVPKSPSSTHAKLKNRKKYDAP